MPFVEVTLHTARYRDAAWYPANRWLLIGANSRDATASLAGGVSHRGYWGIGRWIQGVALTIAERGV